MFTQIASKTEVKVSNDILLSPAKKGPRPEFEKSSLRLMVVDWILFNLALFVGLSFQNLNMELSEILIRSTFYFFTLSNICWLTAAFGTESYWTFERDRLMIREHFYTTILMFGALSLLYYQFFYNTFQIHFLLPSFLLYIFLSITSRTIILSRFNPHRNTILKYAVIGGTGIHVHKIISIIDNIYGQHSYFRGRFGQSRLKTITDLGDYSHINDFLENGSIDKLFYIDSSLPYSQLRTISEQCRNQLIDFEIIPKEIDLFKEGLQMNLMGDMPVLGRKKEPLQHTRNKVLKRLFDIIFSTLVILFVFSWAFPLIALMIKLNSRGPVFFFQERSGYWNKPFQMIKFRTMIVNSMSDKKQAEPGDKRITRIGKILRRTSLDELPQFINVFRGEMSVVGPRPHMIKHTSDYSKIIERYLVRHEVKPGITGWAQVNGWRGPTESLYKMVKRVEFDVTYIENWSLWFDYKCIFLTIINIFKGEANAM